MPEAEDKKPEQPADAKPVGKKVDEAWKEEARKEREKESAPHAQEEGPRRHTLPRADFSMLITSLAMQTVMNMGDFPNPASGEEEVDLEQAKHGIDILGMLEEKTRGNLTPEEAKLIQTTLYDLRLRYVALSGGH